jgi:hypothetical protein
LLASLPFGGGALALHGLGAALRGGRFLGGFLGRGAAAAGSAALRGFHRETQDELTGPPAPAGTPGATTSGIEDVRAQLEALLESAGSRAREQIFQATGGEGARSSGPADDTNAPPDDSDTSDESEAP